MCLELRGDLHAGGPCLGGLREAVQGLPLEQWANGWGKRMGVGGVWLLGFLHGLELGMLVALAMV